MDYASAQNRFLQNHEFRKEFQKKDLAFDISKMIIDARIKRNLSQARLAELLGTKQPSIARFESGSQLPSLTTLAKIAEALETSLIGPQFEFLLSDSQVKFRSPSLMQKFMLHFSPKNFNISTGDLHFGSAQASTPSSTYSFSL